jgi:predicted nucleic acid-binding protein
VRIYLDACVLNRITDDQHQARVRAESDAVEHILRLISERRVEWAASTVLATELLRNPDRARLQDAVALLARAGQLASPSPGALQRALLLAAAGYGSFDAYHLACAEEANADALLTTDDRFIRRAGRRLGNPAVRVLNPVDWLKEVRPWFP